MGLIDLPGGRPSSPMIQPTSVQVRIPLAALIVVALAVLVAISLARITTGAATRTDTVAPSVMASELAQAERPIAVQAPSESTNCGSGAYVSGDIAGNASPSEIYATMCPGR